MLSYKMDFSSYGIVPGFGKSSHILDCFVSVWFAVVFELINHELRYDLMTESP